MRIKAGEFHSSHALGYIIAKSIEVAYLVVVDALFVDIVNAEHGGIDAEVDIGAVTRSLPCTDVDGIAKE